MPKYHSRLIRDGMMGAMQHALALLGQKVLPAEPTDDQLLGVLRQGVDRFTEDVLDELRKRDGPQSAREAALSLSLQIWDEFRSKRCYESTLAVMRVVGAYYAAL